MTAASDMTGLHEATIHTMVRTALMAIPIDPNATDEDKAHLKEDVVLALTMLGPRDSAEAMLAVRAVIAHHASVELLRRAFHTDVTPTEADRLCARHTAMSNLATRLQRELQRLHATRPMARPAPKAEPASQAQPAPSAAPAPTAEAPPITMPTPTRPPQAHPTEPQASATHQAPAKTPPPDRLAA